MATQVPLGQMITLPKIVKVDGVLIFRASKSNLIPFTGGGIDNTAINLLNHGEDIMLHISIRRVENAIVFNTRPRNGTWGNEERVELQGRFKGANEEITIYNHLKMYQVVINGNTAHYYSKRVSGNVDKVHYRVNPGQPPVFYDSITVETASKSSTSALPGYLTNEQLRQLSPSKSPEDEKGMYNLPSNQRQDTVISDPRKRQKAYIKGYLVAVQVLIAFSSVLQFLVLYGNPVLSLYPTTSQDASLPFPLLFIFLSLFIHGNLALLFSGHLGETLKWEKFSIPLPLELLYSLAAVTPALSLFLGKPWQTTAWWSITLFMVFLTQSTRSTIQAGNDGVEESEKMKHRVPDA